MSKYLIVSNFNEDLYEVTEPSKDGSFLIVGKRSSLLLDGNSNATFKERKKTILLKDGLIFPLVEMMQVLHYHRVSTQASGIFEEATLLPFSKGYDLWRK
jgi:hypothetical protein